MKHPCLALLVYIFAFCFAANAMAEDWPQWHGPRRDACSREKGLLKEWPEGGPRRLLTINEVGVGFSTPVIVKNRIYIAGRINKDLHIFCFDMKGNKIWDVTNGEEYFKAYPASRGTPTIDDGVLYSLSGLGRLAAFDTRNGKELWNHNVLEEFKGKNVYHGLAESVLVDGDKVICTPGGSDACLAAFNKKTGKLIWTSKGFSDNASYASALAFTHEGLRQIANMTMLSMVGVAAQDGRPLWRYDRPAMHNKDAQNTLIPIYKDGVIFGASGWGHGGGAARLHNVKTTTGTVIRVEPIWETKDMDCDTGGYVLVDGYIYGNNKNGWACIDFKTGKTMYNVKGIGKGSVTYADGMLYCLAEADGTAALVKADPREYKIVSSFKIPKASAQTWTHPVICNGRLYLRGVDQVLVYDIKDHGRK